jgi:hypothetical protein
VSARCPNGHESDSEDYCDTCGSPIDPSAQVAGGARTPEAGAAGTAEAAGAGAAGAAAAGSTEGVGATPGSATAAPTALECPNCHTANADGALFCEACGYDFTTGAMPRDPSDPGGDPTDPSDPSDPGSDPAGEPTSEAGAGAAAATGTAGPSPASSGIAAPEPFEWVAEVWVDPDWYQTQEADDPCPSPGLPVIVALRDRSVLIGRASASRNTRPQIDLSSDPGVSRRHAQLTTDGTRWFVEDLGSSNGTYVGPAAGPLPAAAIAVGPRTELDDDDRLYVGAWTRVVVRRATPDEVEAYA